MRVFGTALALTGKSVERSGARRSKGLGVANENNIATCPEVMCHEVHCPDELSVDPGTVWQSGLGRRQGRMVRLV